MTDFYRDLMWQFAEIRGIHGREIERILVSTDTPAGTVLSRPAAQDSDDADTLVIDVRRWEILVHPDDWKSFLEPKWKEILESEPEWRRADAPDLPEEAPLGGWNVCGVQVWVDDGTVGS